MTVMIRPTLSVWGRCYSVIGGLEDQAPTICQQFFDFEEALRCANEALSKAETEPIPDDYYFTKIANQTKNKGGK